jgi:ATP-dependent RNA helicase SUPV3L1/SUV3
MRSRWTSFNARGAWLSLAFRAAASDDRAMKESRRSQATRAAPMFAPRVKAVLGPTNTGKTHLAIERLLAHSSGIIGFPLRLLARENYDKMVAKKGVGNVALITGEEKIVPPGARWFSCTVEAMPLDRAVEFLAVDEIQLCADPDRGHVFTDRLLHARGLVETMFMGAETIRPLLQTLIPQAQIETRPRLSQLTHIGPVKLAKLPPRSAVVAFSAAEVYAIAEMIRRRRGGCAVVMGRLSPRTRNAQVELYQNKEVDFLVATDAIGMGLNMDVDVVGFAGLSKFDGHRPRPLFSSEIAQIAGRAGRGMRDGRFGTTGPCPPMDDALVRAVEGHSFERLEQICWRNSDLDFSSIDTLLADLTTPPPGPGLTRGNDATDLETLAALAREPDIRTLATGRTRVRLLWEACQIPDFRKIADDSHLRLCGHVFNHLVRQRLLHPDWLAAQIGAISRTDGDIDTLMQRLAGVRVFAYITARGDWVPDAAHWQARTRAVEEALSDVLHERLTARFVDRRAALLMRRLDSASDETLLSAVTRAGEVVVEGHVVGHVAGFQFAPDPITEGDERRLVWRAARRALAVEIPLRIARLEQAADPDITLAPDGSIIWDNAQVARLRRGAGALRPQIEVLDSEFIDGAARERLRRRLQGFVANALRAQLGPLYALKDINTPGMRGLVHRLEEGLGIAACEAGLPDEVLRRHGIRAGRYAAYVPALLKLPATRMRALLLALWAGIPVPSLPPVGPVSIARPADWGPGTASLMGWVEAGPVLVRLDVAEKIIGPLANAGRPRAVAIPRDLASRLSVRADLLPAVLRGLGFRLFPSVPLPDGHFGPPAPPMMAPVAPRRVPVPAVRTDTPFAALAGLSRRA